MREIVAEAQAPRGSLQHYFPDGKEQLVAEAMLMMGGVVARRVPRRLAALDEPRPSKLLDAMFEDWRRDLTNEDFAAGCPLVGAAANSAATSDRLRRAIADAFEDWQRPLSEALTTLGIPAGRAPNLAMVVVAALEGAIVLARIRRDLVPFDKVVEELGPLLDAAVSSTGDESPGGAV
jgi:AcrR family transcriptional regulator